MTKTDERNLIALMDKAAKRGYDREGMARFAAEAYYGLVTCGPYMPQVRNLADRVYGPTA